MLLRLRQGTATPPDRPSSMVGPAAMMSPSKGSSTVTVAQVSQQTKASRRQSSYYPPASNDFAIQVNPPAKDKKDKRKSGFGQDFAIQLDMPVKKEKENEKEASPPRKDPVKEKRRQSQFYPVAPEEFAIEIKAPPPPPTETIKVEKRKSRAFSSALTAPSMDPSIALEGLPSRTRMPGSHSLEIRSRRSSSSTMASFSTAYSTPRDSFESRGRASSWGSQTSLESMPPLPIAPVGRRTYADYQIQLQSQNPSWARRPSPIKYAYRKKSKPNEIFAQLPGEVLELILEQLKKLHLQPGSDSCATCWMRDCTSIAVSCRKWSKFARTALYEDIQIVGEENGHFKKRYKINNGGRLVLLRRTLRSSPQIAAIVRTLKVPRDSLLPLGASVEEYHNLVASVVMECPNLERLIGFYPSYNHTFSRLFHALSTRRRLKDMNWIIEPSPSQRQDKRRPSISGSIAPSDLQPVQSQDFFDLHTNWQYLTSLTVHCRPGANLSPNILINDALNLLPSLQSLHLSHLPPTTFDDHNLQCLPPTLKKLTLSHLRGLTTTGIASFAARKSSASLTTFHLIHQNIDSLPALCRILSSLTSLVSLSLVQTAPPVLPSDERVMLFPYLASPSVRRLHWDIPYLPTKASVADTILARSIGAGGFPALRVLRAPNDPEAVLQSLCRPCERLDLPADRYRGGGCGAGPGWTPSGQPPLPRSSSALGLQHARTGSRGSSFSSSTAPDQMAQGHGHGPSFAPPTDPSLLADLMPRENSDLRTARLAAQARLEGARRFPRYFVNVVDENGAVVEKHGVGAFMGNVESKITYLLTPDVGGTDEGGGLVGVKELLADGGEELGVLPSQHAVAAKETGWGFGLGGRSRSAVVLGKKERARERSASRDRGSGEAQVNVREGCTGKWNVGVIGDKKDRVRWEHAERGRWRGVVLS